MMKYKREVNDSGGNSKSPSKKTTKSRNPSTRNLTGDCELSQSVNSQICEGLSVQESHDQLEKEQNPAHELSSQNEQNEIAAVEFSQNNSEKSLKSIFSVEELSSDDEIYTLQCPQNFNKQDLVNKNLDFTKSKLSITNKGEVFPLQLLNTDKKFINLAVSRNASGGALIKLPLKGHIVIQKAVDIYAVEPMDSDNSDKYAVKFPDDIKVRHPLLGIDWKSHIDLANTSVNNSIKKLKKRKKEKSVNEGNVETIKIKQESSESEIGSPLKKRKKYEA